MAVVDLEAVRGRDFTVLIIVWSYIVHLARIDCFVHRVSNQHGIVRIGLLRCYLDNPTGNREHVTL